jgi:hypothetical protein
VQPPCKSSGRSRDAVRCFSKIRATGRQHTQGGSPSLTLSGARSRGHLEASRTTSAPAMMRCRRLATGWHSSHSPANTYERLGDARRGGIETWWGVRCSGTVPRHAARQRADTASAFRCRCKAGTACAAPTQRHWRYGTDAPCCRRRSQWRAGPVPALCASATFRQASRRQKGADPQQALL